MDTEISQRFQAIDEKQDLLLRRLSRLAKRLLRRIDELERWRIEHEAKVGPMVQRLMETVQHVDSLRMARARLYGMATAAATFGGVVGAALSLVFG